MADPLVLTAPATSTLARILGADGVVGFQVRAGAPVTIGVFRDGSGTRWFHGASLEAALRQALDGITKRAPAPVRELP